MNMASKLNNVFTFYFHFVWKELTYVFTERSEVYALEGKANVNSVYKNDS